MTQQQEEFLPVSNIPITATKMVASLKACIKKLNAIDSKLTEQDKQKIADIVDDMLETMVGALELELDWVKLKFLFPEDYQGIIHIKKDALIAWSKASNMVTKLEAFYSQKMKPPVDPVVEEACNKANHMFFKLVIEGQRQKILR